MNKTVVIPLAVLLALSCPMLATPDSDEGDEPTRPVKIQVPAQTLTFRVTGMAESMPEVASVRFSIVGDGDTMTKAQDDLKHTEDAVIKVLEKLAVKKSQILTDRFAVTPLQPGSSSSSWGNSTSTSGLQPLGYRVQRNYKVSQPVTADTLTDLLKIADSAIGQGAWMPSRNSSSGDEGYYDRNTTPSLIDFAVLDPDKLVKKAMDDAIERAKELAVDATEKMGKSPSSLYLARVNLLDTGSNTPRTESGNSPRPISSNCWQPIKITVTMETGFAF